LNDKLKRAHGFYGVITIATIIGLLINFIGIDPIQALVYSAVINAIVSVPLLILIFFITRNKNIMGQYTNGWISNLILFITTICVSLAVVALGFAYFT
jgi:Mn2+/Fe2+ NRAMP family transporter